MRTPVAGATNQHQIKSQATRERLLAAAMALVHDKGYGEFSIHAVARAAGMTSGAVQHHFPSRAVLMLDVLQRLLADLEQGPDFWPPLHWSLKRRADHFVRQAWTQLYGQPRFQAAWSAYMAICGDETMVAYVREERGRVGERLQARLAEVFPEMCSGRHGGARAQLVMSTLRGLGLVRPFADERLIAPQLAVLSQFIQSFTQPQEESES